MTKASVRRPEALARRLMPARDQGAATLNSLTALTNRPCTGGLPMLVVMLADRLCTPDVANFTEKTPLPTTRPKLTMKDLGEIVAPGSVAANVTV